MRITGGECRGRTISAPEGLEVRPTASKIRQAFFNILSNIVPDAAFVDVCAGSGLMGFEALSRGARNLPPRCGRAPVRGPHRQADRPRRLELALLRALASPPHRARPIAAGHDGRAGRLRVTALSRSPLPGSEQNAGFKQEAGLCGIRAFPAKRQSRCRAIRPDVRDLCTREEDLVLIGRGQGDRPRIAARAIEQVWGAIRGASCTGDVFEANGNAEPGDGGVLAKAVICQDRTAIGRCVRKRTDR